MSEKGSRSGDDSSPIIIKRKSGGGHAAHHGGAWKIAYADFVTAMMAFFLLMWLLGSTTKGDLNGIAEYFNTPLSTALTGGTRSGSATSVLEGGALALQNSKPGEANSGAGAKSSRDKISILSTSTKRNAQLADDAKRLTELKAKIDRYVVYWRRQSKGQWPVHAVVPDGVPAASLLERTTDRIRHRAVRLRDEIVPFFYTFVPVSVWQKYRQAKSRHHQSAMKSDTGKPVGSLPTGNI